MLGIPSALTLQQVWSAHALLGLSQCFDAVLQTNTFDVRQGRGKDLEATLPTHDAGQGERHFTFGIVGSNRYHGVSSRSTISAIRAQTIPMPYWLAPIPSMIVTLAYRTSFSIFAWKSSSYRRPY
jgi:hypothetical protein